MPALAIPIARNEAPRSRSATTRSGSSGWATRRCEGDERGQQHRAADQEPGGGRIAPAVGLAAREKPNTSANRPADAVSAPGQV